MKNNGKNLLIATAVLALCIVLASFSTSIQGRDRGYEIRPEITLPEQKTDTTRFIESYERILDRMISTNERGQIIADNVGNISEKLESMDKKLDDISARIEKIENALNINERASISSDNNTDSQKSNIGNN